MYKEDYNRNNLKNLRKYLTGKKVSYCNDNLGLSWEWNNYDGIYVLFK